MGSQVLIPLDLPDVNVLEVEVVGKEAIHIKVESTLNYAYCHRCGKRITVLHGYGDWVKVEHLPSFGRAVFIHYRPKRYECPHCDGRPTTRQQLAWHEPNSPHTKAFDAYVLRLLINSTVQDVADKTGLPYDTVWGVLERQVNAQVDWPQYNRLGVIGVDEIARRKGHRDFIVIVTARLPDGHIRLLGILPDRCKATVKAFFLSIPPALRATIQSVCSDLYDGYIEAVREVMPTVRRVVDRFHIAQLYRAAADVLRKTELARLKASLPPEQYKTLKGCLWAFRKANTALNAEEQALLDTLFTLSPALALAYRLREALTAIFNRASSRTRAEAQLQAWITRVQCSGLSCFDTFIKTLQNHWTEILNYFIARETSGFVEGFNNKLKVLKRRCYGLFNLAHFFQLAVLDTEGFRFFA